MKICPVGAELFQVDGRTGMKLIVLFANTLTRLKTGHISKCRQLHLNHFIIRYWEVYNKSYRVNYILDHTNAIHVLSSSPRPQRGPNAAVGSPFTMHTAVMTGGCRRFAFVDIRNEQAEVEVRQSLNRPRQALGVPGCWGSRGRLTPHPSPPRKYSWYSSFLLEAESTPGPQCGLKDYVNEKFQWHQLRHCVPRIKRIWCLNFGDGFSKFRLQ